MPVLLFCTCQEERYQARTQKAKEIHMKSQFESFIKQCFRKDRISGMYKLNENHPNCDLDTFEALEAEGYMIEKEDGYYLKEEYAIEYFG